MTENDKKLIITAEEAERLLCDDAEYIHNFANPSVNLFVGIDYDRHDAIAAFKKAIQIEIGGEHCKHMRHPLAVWDSKTRVSFFEADMDKVAAFEASQK